MNERRTEGRNEQSMKEQTNERYFERSGLHYSVFLGSYKCPRIALPHYGGTFLKHCLSGNRRVQSDTKTAKRYRARSGQRQPHCFVCNDASRRAANNDIATIIRNVSKYVTYIQP
eukprot:scaffold122346_cov22-Prasinocladus_malaysianus.AAC.1